MPRTKQRVFRMTLDEFHRYLDDKGRELKAAYKETGEVQFQFNEIFKQALAGWQEQFVFCYPRLAAQRGELPEEFARSIDAVETEELERIRQEIANNKTEIDEGRSAMDGLLADGQAASVALRTTNPKLDRHEELLKRQVAKRQDEYAQAHEEIETLRAKPMGWLTAYAQIRRLRKVQRLAKKQQTHALEEMRKVRQKWVDQIAQTGDTQAELRNQWQELGIKNSQLQSKADHLTQNLAELAEQAALQRVLEELDSAPQVPGELGTGLADLVQRNGVRGDYEQGLQSVAEALGLLKGVGEGLTRFQRSVQTVLQEQRRYSLAQVKVRVPESVARINQIWEELADRVRDEKHLGTHPLEFSRIVDEQIRSRLTDQAIQTFFENMGEALNEATKAWK